MKKRAIAFLLSILMLVSIFPVSALADENTEGEAPQESVSETAPEVEGEGQQNTDLQGEEPQTPASEDEGVGSVTLSGDPADPTLDPDPDAAPASDPTNTEEEAEPDPTTDEETDGDPASAVGEPEPTTDEEAEGDPAPAVGEPDPTTDEEAEGDPASAVGEPDPTAADPTDTAPEGEGDLTTNENDPESLPDADRKLRLGEVFEGALTAVKPEFTLRLKVSGRMKLQLTFSGAVAVTLFHEQDEISHAYRNAVAEDGSWPELTKTFGTAGGSWFITVTSLEEDPAWAAPVPFTLTLAQATDPEPAAPVDSDTQTDSDTSTEPEAPAGSGDTTDTDTPTEPEAPVDPETQTDPDAAVEPEVPAGSGDTTDTDTPTEPEAPVDPETQTDYDTSTEPAAPAGSGDTTDTDTSTEPAAPAESGDTTDTDTPTEPEAPVDPETQTDPDASTEPAAPVDPETQTDSDTSTEPAAPAGSGDTTDTDASVEPKSARRGVVVSTTTDSSSEPDDSTEPEAPVDPETQTDSDTSTEPAAPAESGDTTDPDASTEPAAPAGSGDTTDPDTSADPETPEEPKDPEDPVDPETPEEPKDPQDPVDPETPEEPKDPQDPVDPETPEETKDPEDPVDPETPEEPKDPEDPEDPEKPADDKTAPEDGQAEEPESGAKRGAGATPVYVLPAESVQLMDVLATLGITLTENNYSVSVDSEAVTLSGSRFNKKNGDVTLTAAQEFSGVTLTLMIESTNGKDLHVITLVYDAPEEPEPIEYTFADENDYVYLLNLLLKSGVDTDGLDDAVAEDESLLTVDYMINDYMVTPETWFDASRVTVLTREGETYVILFHNPKPAELVDTKLEPEVPGKGASMTLTGRLPEGTEAKVELLTAPDAAKSGTFLASFDVTLTRNGEEVQPAEGETVEMVFTNDDIAQAIADGKQIVVLHRTETGYEQVDATVRGSTIVVQASHFSGYDVMVYNIIQRILNAVFSVKLKQIVYDNDNIRLTGLLPENAIVDVAQQTVAIDGEEALLAYDIKIYANQFMRDNGMAWQPSSGNPIEVQVKSDALNVEYVDVYHVADGATDPTLVVESAAVTDAAVSFSADSFSVYVIREHEGGQVVTPRRIYHFIDPAYSIFDSTNNIYKAAPYQFPNQAGDMQTTQIIKSGESLEFIVDPENYYVDDSGIQILMLFQGWYIVRFDGMDGTDIKYDWGTVTPERVNFDEPITFTATEDEDIYLAPLFRNYHFLNFHESDDTNLNNNLITRKLLVLNVSDSATVVVNDIEAIPTDTLHWMFRGWKVYKKNAQGNLTQDNAYNTSGLTYLQTIDSEGNPSDQEITITIGDFDVDLYPYFDEVRWIYFSTGAADNGSTYVPAHFISTGTNDEAYITSLTGVYIPTRVGYTFDGWYLGYTLDSEGEIVQSGNNQVVNSSGVVQSFTDADGFISTTRNGNAALHVNAGWNDDPNKTDGTPNPGQPLKLYAKWVPSNAQYYAYFYLENADGDGYTLDDFVVLNDGVSGSLTNVTASTRLFSTNKFDGSTTALTLAANTTVGTLYSGNNRPHITLNTTDHAIEQQTIKGDGSTVVNVYYDRDEYTLRFYFARSYERDNASDICYQVNTNDEGFQSSANSSVEQALTRYSTNDYQLLSGTNTWKEANVTSAAQILNGSYLTAAGITFDENTNYITISNVPTWPINANGNPGSQTNKTMKYYFIEKQVKYGQNLSLIWPTPGASTTLQNSTARNNPSAHRNQTLTPILMHKYKGGATEYFMVTEVDNTLIENNVNGTVYFLQYFRGGWDTNTRHFTYTSYFEALDGETPDQTQNGVGYVQYEVKDIYTGRTANQIAEIVYPGVTLTHIDRPANNATSGAFTAYYVRNRNDVTFMPQVVSGETVSNASDTSGNAIKISDFPYGETLTLQSIRDAAAIYTPNVTIKQSSSTGRFVFVGWYDNPAGEGTPIDFSNTTLTMPETAVTFYAKWKEITFRVDIDPAGGEIDHIKHSGYTTYPYAAGGYPGGETITAFRPGGSYNKTHATYFFASYGSKVGEYGDLKREFVPDDDATGDFYYYIYTDYRSGWDGEWGLQTDLRNAIYVKESEISAYLAFFNALTALYNDPNKTAPDYLQPQVGWTSNMSQADFLARFAVKGANGQPQKYRPLTGTESYQLLGWYVVENGQTTNTLYNFNSPVTGPIKIRAVWRFYGSYQLKYKEAFTTQEGTREVSVNATVAPAYDPDPNSTQSKYADNTPTTVREKPTSITAKYTDTNETVPDNKRYVFVGWYVSDADGNPLEGEDASGRPVVFYQPGETYMVNSFYARADDAQGANQTDKNTIYMQAYYEAVDSTARRPYVTNLTLDANTAYGGSITVGNGVNVPWDDLGTATVTSDGTNERIRFGDIQSSVEVHLYRYATTKTFNGVTGTQYFQNTNNYLLLGFDPVANPDDIVEVDKVTGVATTNAQPYIPNYAADAVIGVTRNDNVTLYAVWEPMVYITFDNRTASPVAIDLSGTNVNALSIVNQVTGEFDRLSVSGTTITVPANTAWKLVMPKGANQPYSAVVTGHAGYEMTVTNVPVDATTANKSSGTFYNTASETFSGTLANDATGAVVTITEKPLVTFDLNGGTAWNNDSNTGAGKTYRQVTANSIYTESVAVGAHATRPANDPTRTSNCQFIGWTLGIDNGDGTYSRPGVFYGLVGAYDNSLGTLYPFTTASITAPTTLYALWAQPLVTFDVNVSRNGTGYTWNGGPDAPYTHETDTDLYATPVADPTNYKPTDPTRTNYVFVGWVTEDVLKKIVTAAIAAGDTARDTLTEVKANTDWSNNNGGSGFTIDGTTYVNYLAYLKANKWNFNNTPPYGQTLYAVWSQTVTVTFSLRYNTSGTWSTTYNNHSWNGGPTGVTYTQKTLDNYTAYTTQVCIGDTVAQPNNPGFYNNGNYNFLYWTTSSSYCNATNTTPNSVTPFDFSAPVVSNTTLYTSWTQAKSIPVTITKNLVDALGDNGRAFDFTYTVKTWRYQNSGNNGITGPAEQTSAQVDSSFSLKTGEQETIDLRYWAEEVTTGNWPNQTTTYYFYYQTLEVTEADYSAEYDLTFTGTTPSGTASTSGSTFAVDAFTGKVSYVVSGTRRYFQYNNQSYYYRVGYNIWQANTNNNTNVTTTPAAVASAATTFVNTRKYANVTITKTMVDPLLNTNTFNFTGTLVDGTTDITSGVRDTTNTLDLSAFSITASTAVSGAANTYSDAVTFNLPVGAVLTVSETPQEAYTTTVSPSTGSLTVSETAASNALTFTNTRKTQTVTLQKVIDGTDTSGTFAFTATVKYNDAVVTTYDVNGFTDGVRSGISLAHNGTQALTIPYGSILEIVETTQTGYTLDSITATGISGTDDTANAKYTTAAVTADGAVIFTNKKDEVLTSPTGVDLRTAPFAVMMTAGLLLLAGVSVGRRRRREDAE